METKNSTILSILEKYVTPKINETIVNDLSDLLKHKALTETQCKFIRALLEISSCQRTSDLIQEFKSKIDQHEPLQHELDILIVSIDQWYEKLLQQYITHLCNIRSLAKL